MARVIRFHEHGGPEVLRIEDVDVPRPGRGEVQIRVKALGLNRAEASLRSGTYIETPTLPSGLGLEAAGIVETIGFDLYGCVQAVLKPGLDEKGVPQDGRWFDLKRLTAISTEPVMARPTFASVPGGTEKPHQSTNPTR